MDWLQIAEKFGLPGVVLFGIVLLLWKGVAPLVVAIIKDDRTLLAKQSDAAYQAQKEQLEQFTKTIHCQQQIMDESNKQLQRIADALQILTIEIRKDRSQTRRKND